MHACVHTYIHDRKCTPHAPPVASREWIKSPCVSPMSMWKVRFVSRFSSARYVCVCVLSPDRMNVRSTATSQLWIGLTLVPPSASTAMSRVSRK